MQNDATVIGTPVVASTAGRGIFELPNLRVAPVASYFDTIAQAAASQPIAVLKSGSRTFFCIGAATSSLFSRMRTATG